METALILSLLISLIFFISYIFAIKMSFKRKFNKNYSLLSYFPFEGIDKNDYKSFCSLIFYIITLLSGLFISCFFNKNFSSPYFIICLISSILAAFSFLFLQLTNFTYLKEHLFLSAFSFALTLSNYIGLFLGGYKLYKDTADEKLLFLSIINFIFIILILFLLFIAVVNNWNKMKKTILPNGEAKYIRGKVYLLAMLEWVFMILFELSFLFMLLYFLII